MLGISLRSLLSHKLRLALTTIAVILGVSFVAGTFILTDTINATFTSIFATANAGVAVTVHGRPIAGDSGGIGGGQNHPIPTSLLSTVRGVDGVKDAVGNIFREGATLIGHDGKPIGGNGPPTFGANWITDSNISPYHLRKGAPPQGPTDVVIDAGTATKNDLVVGESLPIVFLGGVEEHFTITGIAGYGSSDNLAGATIALFTESTANRVLEGQNKYDSILVSAQSGVTDVVLRERLAAALPSYAVAETGQQAAAAAEQSTESTISTFIGTPLLVFAFISLFVGSFLIINTFNILVAQRTRELALLRALGATRAQVMTSVLTEAAVTGLVASILGFFVGILIARALLSVFGSASTGGVTLVPRTFIIAVLVGTIVTVIAASLPARRATRIAPVAALAEALPETQPLPRRRIAIGLVIFVLGCAALVTGLFTSAGSKLQLIGAGFLGVFLGVALLAPVLVVPVATVLGWPVAHSRGAAGILAGQNARRNPRRTALTAAALMIGLALVTCVAVLTDSVRVSTNDAIEGAFRADFIVFTQGPDFNTQAAQALQQDPRLRDVTEVRGTSVLIRGSSQGIAAIDPANLGSVLALTMVSGTASAIASTNTAIVDSTEATASGVHLGQLVTFNFPQGASVPIRIGGIYTANALVSGYVVSLATMAPNVPTVRDTIVLANAANGVSPSQAEKALHQDVKAFPLLMAMSRSEYRAFVGAGLDSFLNLIYTLLAFAIIIAVLGIANTLILSVLERTREIGLLRALGMTRSQTRSMVRWESVIISLLGAVLGLSVGLGLGVAVSGSLHDLGITEIAVPGTNLILYAIIAGVFGVVAAIFPTIRASRVDILRAITTE
ncbi:MAG: FtsX-like permease family protein [Candidatus Dormiibacterota bacterium]